MAKETRQRPRDAALLRGHHRLITAAHSTGFLSVDASVTVGQTEDATGAGFTRTNKIPRRLLFASLNYCGRLEATDGGQRRDPTNTAT